MALYVQIIHGESCGDTYMLFFPFFEKYIFFNVKVFIFKIYSFKSIKICICLRCTVLCLDICLHCEMTMIKFVSISIASHGCVMYVATLKIYFLCKFQVTPHSIINCKHQISRTYSSCITETVYSLTNVSPFTPLPQALAPRGLLSASMCSTSLVSTVFLCLAYFTQQSVLQVDPCF